MTDISEKIIEHTQKCQEKQVRIRKHINALKPYQCKNLIAVLENPNDIKNIGMAIRNIDALGVEKLYVIDGYGRLPKDWQTMRETKSLLGLSVSAVKWRFVKVFHDTQSCIDHLTHKDFISVVTSPHIKGKSNVILHDGNYTQKRLAVWFGNESRGISDAAIANAEACINIEMFGMVESLNLATCTGIVLYEVAKQRRLYQLAHRRGRRTDPKIMQIENTN